MKTRTFIIATAIAMSSLGLSPAAVGAPSSELPAPHKQGDFTFISGGIGQEEAIAIRHATPYYSLALEFLLKAKPRDEYLSDVKVRIRDANHKLVLNATSNGPFLLANLPDGKYTISAQRNGELKTREVQIETKEHRRVVFEWQS
jgi:hypothetical protein